MKLSFIIPVYNEINYEDNINSLIKQLINFDYELIIVYADSFNPNLVQLSIENTVAISSKIKGRGHQLKLGTNHANGDILIFLHIDTKITSDNINNMLESIQNNQIDYGSFRLRINSNKKIYRIIEFFVNIRSKIFKLPYGDQTIFIKKEMLYQIGGIKDLFICEDVDLMLRCKKHNLKFKILETVSITSSRRWEQKGIISTSLKNMFILLLYLIGIDNKKIYEIYYSR